VVIPSSQESVKEPEKETICITKWSNQESLRLMVQDPDVLSSMVKWTNHQEPEPESDWLVLLLHNISETKKEKTCFSSLTTFSDSPKPVPKCQPC
jgi:hypothetical protein